MNENEKNFLSEIAEKAGEEIKEKVAARFREAPNSENPDPDPETVKMLEELENKKADPDKLLLDAMEDVCDLINLTIAEAEEWGASTAQMIEINRSVDALAEKAIVMHGRLMAGKTIEKLRFMHSVEEKNDENIRKWSEKQ